MEEGEFENNKLKEEYHDEEMEDEFNFIKMTNN